MHDDRWKQPTKDALALLRSKYSDAFFETEALEVEVFLDLVRDEDGKDDPAKILSLAIGLENVGPLILAKFHRETGKPVEVILQELALTLERSRSSDLTKLANRLTNRNQVQGARYEMALATEGRFSA